MPLYRLYKNSWGCTQSRSRFLFWNNSTIRISSRFTHGESWWETETHGWRNILCWFCTGRFSLAASHSITSPASKIYTYASWKSFAKISRNRQDLDGGWCYRKQRFRNLPPYQRSTRFSKRPCSFPRRSCGCFSWWTWKCGICERRRFGINMGTARSNSWLGRSTEWKVGTGTVWNCG